MTTAASLIEFRPHTDVRTFFQWMACAWRLFRSTPLRLMGLALLPVMAEVIMQLIPVAGIVVSKVLTPLVFAWVLAMVDSKARIDAFAPGLAGGRVGRRWVRLLALALVMLSVFLLQLLISALIGGWDQALALATGDMAALRLSRGDMAWILASGVLPGALLMFAMPRVLLDDTGVEQALRDSIQQSGIHWRPMLCLMVLSAGMVFALPWAPWLLLLFLPVALYVPYAAYRHVFDRAAA